MRKNDHFSFIAKCQKRTGWLRSKLCNFFVLMLFLVMFPSALLAQHRAITGTVFDGNGESIIGVNVIELGTTNGTITDVEGRFSLNVSSPLPNFNSATLAMLLKSSLLMEKQR